MDPRLLKYYNRELQHLREMGGEFAREFPKVAGRLGLDQFECADPYVERLLEAFGFLAARIQLKLDAEFPRFTQHLLESVYPHYLAPLPSMAVVQLEPDPGEGALVEGFTVPRGSTLRSVLGKGDTTACEYRTAHEVTLWPLALTAAQYYTSRDLSAVGVIEVAAKAAIRLRLRSTAVPFDKLPLDSLPLFLRGKDQLPVAIHEQLVANAVSVLLRPVDQKDDWQIGLDASAVRATGFDDEQAMLPYGPRSFQGYRLLQEYFAFPQRYLFVELRGLAAGVRRCRGQELDVFVLLDRVEPTLEGSLDVAQFVPFCSPAVNLFPKRADRVHLKPGQDEHHVVPDRTRPMDFEVFRVDEVVGHGTSADVERVFRPFYVEKDADGRSGGHAAFFTVRRVPTLLPSARRREGPRSSYVGNEVFVDLVDADEAPYSPDLRQLSFSTLCTNRDLPLQMSLGIGETDFTMESGAPVRSVRCLAGPTRPRPTHAEGKTAWRLCSHLSLNYLSLVDEDVEHGAAALRELLSLYAASSEAHVKKQVEGVLSVESRAVTRRIPGPGPIAFGRGLEVALTCDESQFEGIGPFLLGAVLERFFARYASINSFTQTVLRTTERGEVHRWPMRTGRRPVC